MKKLYLVRVEKTYAAVVYCEAEDAKRVAKDAVADEPDYCSESTLVYAPQDVRSLTDVPKDWHKGLPYGEQDGDEELTVEELLAAAAP